MLALSSLAACAFSIARPPMQWKSVAAKEAVNTRSSNLLLQQPGWYPQNYGGQQSYGNQQSDECPIDPGGYPQQNLPPGWYAKVDPQCGRMVYCNQQSGVCQWDPPSPLQGGYPQQALPLPAGWYASVDPQSGRPVYCNERSGQCQWDLPRA